MFSLSNFSYIFPRGQLTPFATVRTPMCPSFSLFHGAAACLSYRHAGCLQLSHRRSPDMCVDPPRFLDPRWPETSNCHRRGRAYRLAAPEAIPRWSRASASRLGYVLIGCSETPKRGRLVFGNYPIPVHVLQYVHTGVRELVFVSVQLSSCAVSSGVTSHRQPRQCRGGQGPKTVKWAQSDPNYVSRLLLDCVANVYRG